MLVTILSYAEDEHSARWHPRWMLATFVARDTHLTEMNPTISSNFAEKRLKTSTQLVAGLTITVTDVTSDVFGGNEFLVLKTQELGEAEGLAISCFTKGRQGNYYNPDGTISEQRTMRYPQGTAVDAYKKVFNEVQALPESERTYGVLAERLRSVFNGKKIAITADNYVDRYGTERALRHFNFA
jgi:hypothetical protein